MKQLLSNEKLQKDLKDALAELERIKKNKALLDAQQKTVESWILSVVSATGNGKTTFTDADNNEIVSITNGVSYKVDSELLDKVAKEHQLESQVPYLFRFKAEVISDAWNGATEEVRQVFAQAVTATASKPSISSAAVDAAVKEYKKSL